MLQRLVVLVPCFGSAEVLPSSVLPTDVLAGGPVLSFSIARDKEVFWSVGAYHLQEVNEFASAVAGHAVKGDVCIVQTFPKGALGCLGGRSLDDLLKEWRFGAKLHRQAREEQSLLVGLEEPSFGVKQDTISTSVESDNGAVVESGRAINTSGSSVQNPNGSVNVIDPHIRPRPSFTGCESMDATANTSSTPRLREDGSRRQSVGMLPRNPPQQLRCTKHKFLLQGTGFMAGQDEGKDASENPVQGWDDLHPDILCWIARKAESGKMVIAMCGVSPHWRKYMFSDAPMVRGIPFRLNLSRPLRNVSGCGVLQKTLHRRHIGSLPRILLKAADLNNIHAISSLANLYEASSMHVDAVQQWRKLSMTGDLHGSWKYGEALYNGKGIGRDAESAQHLFLRIGKQILRSDAPKTSEMLRGIGLCLGYLFLDGEAGKQDNEKAVHWFQIAAENGCLESETTLGWMFNTGQYG
ncbi:hypothetical protein BSKO_03413 [Bryopsis sp. KO-2023]|nr:hypothetical protein BSKO_03413 [Bryopsis sp. KO-2023]